MAKTYTFSELLEKVGNYGFWYDGETVDISNDEEMHIIVKAEGDMELVALLKERILDDIKASKYANLEFTKSGNTYTDTRL